MLKREVLWRCVVFVFCVCFVAAAASVLPGGVRADEQEDAEAARAEAAEKAFVELCEKGTAEQVKQALKDGADPYARKYGEEGSFPALTLAAAAGNLPVVRVLLEARREQTEPQEEVMVDDYDSDSCWTALMAAAESGHPGVVEALLAAGANPKLQDADGHDALWRARHPNEGVSREGPGRSHSSAGTGGPHEQKTGRAMPLKLPQEGIMLKREVSFRCASGDMPKETIMKRASSPTILLTLALLFAVGVSGVGAAETPDKTYKNSIGMEFVLIPAGTFRMGCSSEAKQCEDSEKPRHEVKISRPFYLGKYEVTQAQWEAVMGDNPSVYKGADRPVHQVSWVDAQQFIEKLNAREGHNRYRLPTEAEWEYAARAGSAAAYGFGDDAGQLGHYAWYADNADEEPQPVGRKRPNAWGLFDMHGNVWEWVHDWYGAYGPGAVTDPQGRGAGGERARRGGSWSDSAEWCRSAFRSSKDPGRHFDSTDGFRLALTPDDERGAEGR